MSVVSSVESLEFL